MEWQYDDLRKPFDAYTIKWRVGATNKDKTQGMALAYIDARDALNRLNEVVGPQNWQKKYPWASDKKIVCEVGIKFDGEWIWKADGAGDTDYEADKGAFSDAFKRACVSWGIGQYLYNFGNHWVPIQMKGKSQVFTEASQRQLTDMLSKWQKPILLPFVIKSNLQAVDIIIKGLSNNELSPAAEAWAEMPEETRRILWAAKKDGGPFTNPEKEIMKGSEFVALENSFKGNSVRGS